jgi:hypothetical protein
MFASNFTVADKDINWIRGKDKLTRYSRDDMTTTGNDMGTCNEHYPSLEQHNET